MKPAPELNLIFVEPGFVVMVETAVSLVLFVSVEPLEMWSEPALALGPHCTKLNPNDLLMSSLLIWDFKKGECVAYPVLFIGEFLWDQTCTVSPSHTSPLGLEPRVADMCTMFFPQAIVPSFFSEEPVLS